jgi:hypothetical protein
VARYGKQLLALDLFELLFRETSSETCETQLLSTECCCSREEHILILNVYSLLKLSCSDGGAYVSSECEGGYVMLCRRCECSLLLEQIRVIQARRCNMR